jgi:hypothetical protein
MAPRQHKILGRKMHRKVDVAISAQVEVISTEMFQNEERNAHSNFNYTGKLAIPGFLE